VTQEYLVGELSLLLGELQAATVTEPSVAQIGWLRRESETGPRSTLPAAAVDALCVCDRVCWDSLTRGDVEAFARQSTVCAELWEFGVCSGLVEDR
jgi:hypothetical protein